MLLLAQGRLRCDLRTRSGMTLGVLSIYCVIFHADQHLVRGGRVPELWYLGPQLLWVFCVVCLWGARRVRASNRVRLLRMATLGALGFLLAVASWAIRLERASYDGTLALYEAAQWVNTNLPPDTIVGCWDAGVFGYYAEPLVVNLDGLVNSLEFAQALQSVTGVQFLDRKWVSYLAQYFPRGFENYCPTGFDAAQLHARAQQTLFVRPVTARSFADLIRTGRRPLRHWTVEVRAWAPPAAAPTSLTKSPAAAPTAESRSALAEQPR